MLNALVVIPAIGVGVGVALLLWSALDGALDARWRRGCARCRDLSDTYLDAGR